MLRENREKQVITLNWKEEVNMDISVQMSPEKLKHRHLEVADIISNRTSTRQKKKNHLLQGKMIFYGQQYKG